MKWNRETFAVALSGGEGGKRGETDRGGDLTNVQYLELYNEYIPLSLIKKALVFFGEWDYSLSLLFDHPYFLIL
jgi:hypothetical protein